MKTKSLLTLLAAGSALLALAVCSPLALAHDEHDHGKESAAKDDAKPEAKAAECSACKRPAPPEPKIETEKPAPPAAAEAAPTTDVAAKAEVEPETCPITGDPLDEDAIEVEVDGKIVKVCCKPCVKDLLKQQAGG